MMKSLVSRFKAFALLLAVAAYGGAWGVENPVTGETETYSNTFTGSGNPAEWNNSANWDTAVTPFISGNYDASLVDSATVSTSTAIDGWTLRVGAYNGASVTWSGGISKIQAGSVGCWLTADETSSITIASFAGNQLEGSDSAPFKLTSANAGGITWSGGITSASNTSLPFWYYLKGAGTVVYGGDITVANAQVIKQTDITLSGTSQVASKTLVTFGSGTTKTFTADATIKRLNSSGTDLNDDAHVATVNTTGATTLTTSDAVGTCELVQTTTGIVLYWVDGDPSDLPVYKRSININFTHGTSEILTTDADVGLSGYAVPGTSWNNFGIGQNDSSEQTFNTVKSIDSTGTASVEAGVSVNVSGHRGSYYCSSLTAASNLLQGYIDEGASKATPTVTITGIPYDHYRVIVYHSTDQENAQFGYDTINGFDFTYVNGVQAEGTTSWGSAGATNSAEPIDEGVNTLVSAVLTGDTVTMVAHRIGGDYPSARGCFAAIQVVEYVPEVGENDLEIAVNGATEYGVTETKNLSGTVYLTGSGTLTLTGSEKITAATIDVAKDVVLNINASRLDATTFTGAGTVVYDTTAPVEGKGWANIGWSGTVWIKNQSVSSFEGTKFGNTASTVRFTGVTGFLQTSSWNSSTYVHTVPLELVDDGETVAFTYNNGWGGNLVKINTLKGTGTLKTEGSGLGEHIYIVDGSGFTGVFNLTGKYVYVGGSQPDYSASVNPNGKLEIRSGVTMTVPSGKTWTANGGFVVNGTLNVNGTLASSHTTKAVSGAGTVVFTGRAPTVSGDAWWKNADWTGTVQVKDVTNMVGDSRTGVWLKFNDYGNSGSVVEMNNVTGWLEPGYTCTPKIKITGTLYLNNGGSGKASAFKVGTLLGSGTISGDGSAVTVVFNITDDWSGFTGTIGLNNKCVVFGETIPDSLTAGTIYVSSGAVVTPQQSSGVWWAVNGIKVDGELRAPNLSKFGGGTGITTGDNGVFTLTSTANVNDANYGSGATSADLSRITGTGTLKYSSTAGWRAFPTADDHMPASTLTLQMELADSLIISQNNGETVVGSLAGSKNIRSDFGSNGGNGRILTVTQSKDTEWEGKFVSNRITQFNVVAPAEGTPGTLTLSGTQSLSGSNVTTIPMQIDGSVNLTGTWVGDTTVAGTFGGTGTVTGNLTLTDGATFKAAATALTVSGTVTLPTGAGETLTIDATGLDADEVTILSSSSITTETDVSKVTVANGLYNVTPVAGALKLVTTKVEITVPVIAHTTVTVTVGGETIGTASGTYKVVPDAVVTVTYAAVAGYEISGTTVYTIDVANSETTFDPTGTTQVAQYVAQIVDGASYTSLQAAFNAVADNNKIVLLASTEDGATLPSRAVYFYFYAGNYECGTIADATGDFATTQTDETIEINEVQVTAKKYRVSASVAVVTVPNEGSTNYGDYMMAYNAFIAAPAGTTMRIIGTDPFGENITCATYDSETQTYTKLVAVASITTGVFTDEYPSLANAVAGATAEQTVKLLDNIALDTTVAIPKTLTLNLNGYAITASGINAISTSGALTMSGSGSITVTSGGSVVLTDSAATLRVPAGVTLSPAPTSGVSGMSVVSSGSDPVDYSLAVVPINNVNDVQAGYMENGTAVITNTSAAVTIPGSASATIVTSPSGVFTIVASAVQLQTDNFLTITATYGSGLTQDITSAFASAVVGGDPSAAQLRMTFSGVNTTVRVDTEDIKVQPEVDATSSPMTVSGAAPTFNVKTIPGLWYVVDSGTAPGSLVAGTAVQATGARSDLSGASLGENEAVKYYMISVGLTKNDAEGN